MMNTSEQCSIQLQPKTDITTVESDSLYMGTEKTSNGLYEGTVMGAYPRTKWPKQKMPYMTTCKFRAKERDTELNVRMKFKKL